MKKIELCFSILFVLFLSVPFALAHREEGRIAYMENRIYAPPPKLLSIDWLNLPKIAEIVALYQPDIVLFENTETSMDTTIPLVLEMDL